MGLHFCTKKKFLSLNKEAGTFEVPESVRKVQQFCETVIYIKK